MVIPTGLTTMKCTREIGGIVEYTCEHCGQRNLQNVTTTTNKEGTGHVLFSEEHKAKLFEKLDNEALIAVKAQESKLFMEVNVEHNCKKIRYRSKCTHCGKKQSWNIKKGNEASLSNMPVYYNRMDCVLKRCSRCGSQEKVENRFCTVCGNGVFFEPKTELLTNLIQQSQAESVYQNISNEIEQNTPTAAVQKENKKCKASFCLGVFSIFLFIFVIPQLLSIYFGICGLRETKTTNERGEGQAIVGIVFASLALLTSIGLFFALLSGQ